MVEAWLRDTEPKMQAEYVRLLRGMSAAEKVERIFELIELQRGLAEADVRRLYPEAGEEEIFLRTAARSLGREDMIRAYGWDPEGAG